MDYVVIAIFLLLSGLFSGSEIAFLSANKLRVELLGNNGTRQGRIVYGFFSKPSQFLGILLVGNNIALVIFSELFSEKLEPFFQQFIPFSNLGLLLSSTLVITIIVLIFGEFLPKSIFRLYSDKILLALAFPLKFIEFILILPARIITSFSNIILTRFFGAELENDQEVFTRLDLENFIKSSNTTAEEEIDTELFEKALHLREVRVRECMVPRNEIVGLDITSSISELIEAFKSSKHSRVLIYEDDIDNILGYTHHQQLMKGPKTVRKVCNKLPYVPESMHVRQLMNQFIKNNISIACVVDEFGGTAGIITLEDILEEIFGEIADEHDAPDYINEQLDEFTYRFSGRLELDQITEKYPELSFPSGDYHTLSGYLVMTTENIPEAAGEIYLENYKFIIEAVTNTKIETILLIVLNNEEQDHTDSKEETTET